MGTIITASKNILVQFKWSIFKKYFTRCLAHIVSAQLISATHSGLFVCANTIRASRQFKIQQADYILKFQFWKFCSSFLFSNIELIMLIT